MTIAASTAAPITEPGTDTDWESDTDSDSEHDRLWNVLVWNDPVTLMSYVVYVLRKLFGHDEPTAMKLMLQIHHEGKAVVASGPRDESETQVAQLHAHGLQATLAKD